MAVRSGIWHGWAAPVALFLTIVAFASGSSSILDFKSAGLTARWVCLFALCAIALALAAPKLRGGVSWFVALPGALLALAVLSTAWSVAPWTTFERAGTIGTLFALGAALAVASRGEPALRRRILVAAGAAAGVIAVAGFVMLVFGVDAASQQVEATSPWRFRGFGENPNTIPLLAAVALPGATWEVLRAESSRLKLGWAFAVAALLATCIATESRGGLLAAFLGVAVVLALLVPRPMHKVASIATIAALCLGGVVLRQVEQPPLPATSATPAPVVTTPTMPPPRRRSAHLIGGAAQLPARKDEIGAPVFGYSPTTAGSGRVAEWEGVLDLIRERPFLGFGFGTEPLVFVDRWYYFDGGTAENSFLGMLLQLGVVGLLLFAVIAISLVRRSLRAIGRVHGDERGVVAVGLGVLVAAAALMLIQSYVYSVGNVGSVTVWVTLFVLGDVVWRFSRRPESRAHDA